MIHILKPGSLISEDDPSIEDYEVQYTRVLRHGGYKGEIRHYETEAKNELPSDVKPGDTILIGGSKLNAWEDDEFTNGLVQFVQNMLKVDGVKLIGLCYGHQLIARALGANTGRAGFWELCSKKIKFTEEGREFFSEVDETHGLMQVHRDQVFEVPEGATLLMSSDVCPVQAYYRKGKYLCMQGHPEFTAEIVHSILLKLKMDDEELYTSAVKDLEIPHNGLEYSFALARFINE